MQRCACGNSDTARFRRYWDGNGGGDDEDQALLGVACAPCGQEWLQGEYVNTEGEERLVFGESEFRENVTVPDAVQTSLQVRGSRTKIGHNEIHILKAGDHITWHRPWIIWHHAVILEVNVHTRQAHVVHWEKTDCADDSNKIRICKEWLKLDDQLGDLYRIDYPDDVTEKNPPNLVIARALSRLDETGYGLLKNNCEGFAAFCKTGVSESCQTHWFWAKFKEIVCTTVGQFAKTATKTVCAGIKEAINSGASAASEVTLKEAGGSVATVGLAETIETAVPLIEAGKNIADHGLAKTLETVERASNWIGAGLVFAIEGGFCIWDLSKIYENRKNSELSRKDFIESIAQRISEGIFAAGFAVGGSLIGEILGVAAGAALGSVIPVVGNIAGAAIGVFVGSVIGGVFGSLAGKIFGSVIGPYVGKAIVYFIKRDDRAVATVDDLDIGDHVVFYRWLLHPRHHAIVSAKDSVHNKLRIIHSTHKRGVVEEWVDFVQPVYKVIYPYDECYPTNDVIGVARSQLGYKEYSLITNNCKDFARWCKEM